MKRFFILSASVSAVLIASALVGHGDGLDATTETQLISVLQGSQSAQEKAAACAALKWTGTDRCVPALAQLLTDKDLSHAARYALESMRGPAAGDALRAALPQTTGSNEVGIIDSLAVRCESASDPVLIKLLSDANADVAVAAARALGRIADADALKALQTAWEQSVEPKVHSAQADALLTAASQLLTKHRGGDAKKVFQELYGHEKDDGLRFAAFRGLILSSEKQGIILMTEAIKEGKDPAAGAALQLAATIGGTATTHALAELLKSISIPEKIAVLQALQQRGDRTAVPGIREMLASTDENVRMAAIAALGDLGDGTVVAPLALDAATMGATEKAAARQALVDLRHGGNVTDELLKTLASPSVNVQIEAIRALGSRGDTVAAPKFLELAQSTNDDVRAAAFEGLALLGSVPQVPGLIQFIVNSTDDDIRSAAADTLTTICEHIQVQGASVDAAALAQSARSSPAPARAALLGVCSGVADPQIREVLRAAVTDPDSAIRAAAVRALCASQDEELLPDMLKLAADEKAGRFRMLAIRGAVRLTMPEAPVSLPVTRKVEILKSVLPDAFNTEARRLVLSSLGNIQDPEALQMAESLLDDSDVKVEADDAVVRIARSISKKYPEKAAAALHRVMESSDDAAIRKSAQAALKRIKSVN